MKYHAIFKIYEDVDSATCKQAGRSLRRWKTKELKSSCFVDFDQQVLRDLDAGERPSPLALRRLALLENANLGFALSQKDRECLLHGMNDRHLDVFIEILIPRDQESPDEVVETNVCREALARMMTLLPEHFIEKQLYFGPLDNDFPDESALEFE